VPCGSTTPLSAPGWSGSLRKAALNGSTDPAHSYDFGALHVNELSGRIVVLDAAVAPWHQDAAIRQAASELLELFSTATDPLELLLSADAHLYDPSAPRRHDNVIFTAALCDIEWSTGSIRAAIAGDCEVWVRKSGAWMSLAEQDSLTTAARLHWDARTTTMSHSAQWDLQREYLDDPALWNRPPLGLGMQRFASVALDNQIHAIDGVIVSSDGARLTAQRCEELDEWISDGLSSIHADPPGPGHRHPHGDLFVVRFTRDTLPNSVTSTSSPPTDTTATAITFSRDTQ
jgi:hypothetical protein